MPAIVFMRAAWRADIYATKHYALRDAKSYAMRHAYARRRCGVTYSKDAIIAAADCCHAAITFHAYVLPRRC